MQTISLPFSFTPFHFLLYNSIYGDCLLKSVEDIFMVLSFAEKQQRRRKKMRDKNLTLVQVWVPNDRTVELKSIVARMINEKTQDLEPSPRQIAFAQFLCNKKGLRLSQDVLSSSKKLFEWLNENKSARDKYEIKS